MSKAELFSVEGNTIKMKAPLYTLIVKAYLDKFLNEVEELMGLLKSGFADGTTARGLSEVALQGSLEALRAFLGPGILRQVGFAERDIRSTVKALRKAANTLKAISKVMPDQVVDFMSSALLAAELNDVKKRIMDISCKLSYVAYL